MHEIKGWTALVTGASSGLGVDFAKELARRGCSLVLVARREAELQALAAEIRAAHPVQVDVVAMDLGAPGAPERLHAAVARPVDILVNNAGFGLYGKFVDIDLERERAMLELDVVALVGLSKLFVRDMVARGRGCVLQVASIGAYQPSPLYASYSAAKAFVLSFGEALAHELRGTGVSCTVVSPGVTRTAFLEVAGQAPNAFQKATMMESPEVARIGIDAMVAGRSSVVTGLLNAFNCWLMSMLPRPWAAAIGARAMRA